MNPYTQTFDNSRPSPQSQSGDPASNVMANENQQMLAQMARMPQQPQNQFAKPIGPLYVPGYAASPGANNTYGRLAFEALPPPPSSGPRIRTDPSGQQPQPQQQQSKGFFDNMFDGGKSYRRKARKAAKKSRKARKSAKKSRRSSRR